VLFWGHVDEHWDGNGTTVREEEELSNMHNGCRPIRILRVVTISALLLCIPVGYAFALVGFWLARSFVAGFAAGGVLILTFVVSFIALAVWPCPQCHKRFVRFNAFWPRSCSHCGQGC
jgi:hypothetical protein